MPYSISASAISETANCLLREDGLVRRSKGVGLKQKQHPCPQLRALRGASEADRPGASCAKGPDQRHKFLRPGRVIFGRGRQVFDADWRLEYNANREPYLSTPRFRSFRFLRHTDLSLAQPSSADVFLFAHLRDVVTGDNKILSGDNRIQGMPLYPKDVRWTTTLCVCLCFCCPARPPARPSSPFGVGLASTAPTLHLFLQLFCLDWNFIKLFQSVLNDLNAKL
jgi:hypothetical protein